jgi:hypothetical protein
VRRPTEDICGFCYREYNASNIDYQITTSADDQVEEDNSGEDNVGTGGEARTGGSVDVDKKVDEWEKLLLNASLHGHRAKAQRKLLHDKQTKTTKDQLNNVPHSSEPIV